MVGTKPSSLSYFWRTSCGKRDKKLGAPLLTNYCPFPTKVEKKDSKDRKYVVFIDSGVGISVDGDPEATDTHCGTVG